MDKVEQIRAFLVGIADADGVSTILARAIEKQILPYIDSLQKEQLTRSVTKTSDQEEPVSEELEEAAEKYAHEAYSHPVDRNVGKADFITGAKWQKEHLWKPADGDELPEIDREVIALLGNGEVVFAHRPPEFWDGYHIVYQKVLPFVSMEARNRVYDHLSKTKAVKNGNRFISKDECQLITEESMLDIHNI